MDKTLIITDQYGVIAGKITVTDQIAQTHLNALKQALPECVIEEETHEKPIFDANLQGGLWISRHQPTDAQILNARQMGFELRFAPDAWALAKMDIQTDADVELFIDRAIRLLDDAELDCCAIFGVMPVPVRAEMHNNWLEWMKKPEMLCSFLTHATPVYEAWNIQRSVEGQKPTFEHRKWCLTGYLE